MAAENPLETPYKPPRVRGDRGNAYKREKLIHGRTPKEMGIRKTFKKVPWFWATCDHKDKRGRLDCKQKFGGLNVFLVMGNKALHENAHEKKDRQLAERAALA